MEPFVSGRIICIMSIQSEEDGIPVSMILPDSGCNPVIQCLCNFKA